MWNTALHDLPLFADNLAKWLPTIDARYITLVKGRFAISGRYVISVSLNHIDRLVSKDYVSGTFRAPFMVSPTDLVAFRKGGLLIPADQGDSVKKGESAVPRYYDNPELLDTIDEEMGTHILSCIDDEDTVEELKDDVGKLGTLLLIHFESQRASVTSNSNDFGAAILAEFNEKIAAGIASADVPAFSRYKSETNKLGASSC